MPKPQILFCNALPVGLDDAIMYIPEGSHQIECMVNGRPKKITVNMPAEKGSAVAAAMQTLLDKKLTNNVRPVFDFDHANSGPASALPQRFFYEQGRGLMVECEWTGAGRKARKNKDYSYFSPTFLRDEESGEPVGLPDRGPLGALVNDPAFRDIQRVAAANVQQKAEPNPNPKPTNTNTMKSLVTAGILTEAEAAQSDASTVAASRVKVLQTEAAKVEAANITIANLTKERDALLGKVEAANTATAKATVATAVQAGRILPKDEASQKYWEGQLVAAKNEDELKVVTAALEAIPAKNKDITNQVITEAGGTNQTTGGASDLVTAARKLVTAGEFPNEDAATQHLCSQDPKLYDSYLAGLATSE